ncbi:MAG: alpha/beta hydrolase [Rhodocyclaceae bacterium]|nr:alpha/beta hydrolase [Rhodocyclaceae bacterium]MCZ7654790.1 alpha/beta hydrolase [Rhodocyclaceae bacterium]
MNRLGIVLFALCAQPLASLAQIEVKELPSRPGVTVRFVYAKAENPIASAVLFQGGAGAIGIYPNGSMRVENFLSGGAHRFTSNGISVAIPDVPSDRRTLDNFRGTLEHAQDNAVMIAFLRQQAAVPVWAVGTSNGSLSAAATAAHLKDKGPDGIVLTASTTRAPVSQAHSVLTAPLHEVTVPALIVHHKQDACHVTPFSAMPELMAALKSAKTVELIEAEGGTNNGSPCHSGHHQFQGIEAAVTKDIADWIRRYQAASTGKP